MICDNQDLELFQKLTQLTIQWPVLEATSIGLGAEPTVYVVIPIVTTVAVEAIFFDMIFRQE